MTRRLFTTLAAATSLLCSHAAVQAEEKLNIYVWPEFLPKSVVEKFEKAKGCKVTVEEYTSNEDMIAKVGQGGSGYDLVCPSDYAISTMVRQELLLTLDPASIPNAGNTASRFQKPKYDPEGKYCVPYLAGTTGIGYRKDKLKDAPVKKWAELFDEERLKALKGKISLIDDPKEGPAPAFLAAGLNPNATAENEVSKILTMLQKQKAFLAGYDSETFEDTLVKGETWVAQGYSGDFAAAMEENENIGYLIPEEGCVVAVDNWAVLKDAKNATMAQEFINFLNDPAIAAEVVNETGYIPCNGKAESLVEEKIRKSPTFQLPAPDKSFSLEDLGQDAEDKRAELWTTLKAE